MKRLTIFILLAITSYHCTKKTNELSEKKDTLVTIAIDTAISKSEKVPPKEIKMEKVAFDFLTDCDSLEIWSGEIQGLQGQGPTGMYLMGQCFSTKHYDLIINSGGNVSYHDAIDPITKKLKPRLFGAQYYVFEITKVVPENPENEFDTYDYVYPSEVKIYKLFDDGWYLINKETIDSFEELGTLKLNTVNQK